jgi:uncharacterized protein YprB with RNaseH-like and TPR domain
LKTTTTIRRLFFDIETSPNLGIFWKAGYKINISYENIVKERAVICAAWKWAGEKEVKAAWWDEKQDDKALLQEFLKEAHQADELVAHNGDRFDLRWIKTRCLFHGLQTFPRYKTIDTLKWSKNDFYFNSNRLDYIARFLGLGGKLETKDGLWRDVLLRDDRKRLAEMVKYNKQDVVLLEQVYDRLADHVVPKTHVGVLQGNDRWTCAYCGSEDVIVNKTRRITAAGTVQKQMLCQDCGRYYSIAMKSYMEYLEAKAPRPSTC